MVLSWHLSKIIKPNDFPKLWNISWLEKSQLLEKILRKFAKLLFPGDFFCRVTWKSYIIFMVTWKSYIIWKSLSYAVFFLCPACHFVQVNQSIYCIQENILFSHLSSLLSVGKFTTRWIVTQLCLDKYLRLAKTFTSVKVENNMGRK